MPQIKSRTALAHTSHAAAMTRRALPGGRPGALPGASAFTRSPRPVGRRRALREAAAAEEARRELFVALIDANDVMESFETVDDDVLINFARGMALEALQGGYERARNIATREYRIPDDVVELATAAALVVWTPYAAQGLLMGPSDADIDEVRDWLAEHGYTLARA